VEVLREAQKLAPANPTLQNNLGYLILERGGNVEEASRLIEAALDKEPGNPSTMDSWGWALYKQGKFHESEETLRKAVSLTPYSPEAHRHLGETLLKLDRLQEALEEWERALAFVFPDRKELEKQAQELRTRVARSSRQGSEETATETDEPDPSEPEDEGTDSE
jgi:Flp pilus assembly protein TadD